MVQPFLTFLLAWYNLPFTLMLGLGVLLAGLQLFGLSHEGDTDADAHVDVDGHVDLDHDLDTDIAIHHDLDHDLDTDVAVEHDLDLDHSIDHDLDHGIDLDHSIDHDLDHDIDHSVDHDIDHSLDHSADHSVSRESFSGFSLLAFIGIGKAPLMVVLLIVLMTTGLLGWFLNGLAVGVLGFFPALLLLGTFLVSLVIGTLVTSRVARFIGRTLPPISSTATRAQALVGRPGTVISPFVDGRYGMVHLRDDGGTLISLFAVTEDAEPIPRGESVILLSYDAAQRLYLVTRR